MFGQSRRTCLLQQPWLVNYSSVCNWNAQILKGHVTKSEVKDQRASSKTGRLAGPGEGFSIHLHLLCGSPFFADENWIFKKWSNVQTRVWEGERPCIKYLPLSVSGKHRFESCCSETSKQSEGTARVSAHTQWALGSVKWRRSSKDQEGPE